MRVIFHRIKEQATSQGLLSLPHTGPPTTNPLLQSKDKLQMGGLVEGSLFLQHSQFDRGALCQTTALLQDASAGHHASEDRQWNEHDRT